MADRTGRAMGTLNPVIYFRKTNGPAIVTGVLLENHIILPPIEIGRGDGYARAIWEARYKNQGYEYCEAGTLSEVQRLQQHLIDQEQKILSHQAQVDYNMRERLHKETAANLRQRMASSDCSPYEREFIKLWLEMVASKQDKYTALFEQRNLYLQALEFDSNHKPEDRMR